MTIRFSVCMPYHENPGMLAEHFRRNAQLPPYIRNAIEFIICDDASTERAAFPQDYVGDVCGKYPRTRIFHMPGPHVPWSHRCASNIAAHFAVGDFLLITDIDHLVPLETWRYLFACDTAHGDLRRHRAYTFERVNYDGSPYRFHPDSWLFHYSLWETIKGYDERYRGQYGQNWDFIERVKHHAAIDRLPVPLMRVSRDDIPDASERVLTRKSAEAKAAIAALRREFKQKGSYYADTRLSAPFDEVFP